MNGLLSRRDVPGTVDRALNRPPRMGRVRRLLHVHVHNRLVSRIWLRSGRSLVMHRCRCGRAKTTLMPAGPA